MIRRTHKSCNTKPTRKVSPMTDNITEQASIEVSEERTEMETETEAILKGMLLENTGTHPLDSGGTYGRHWQHNQGRHFDVEFAAIIKFGKYRNSDGDTKANISVILNVYHWLKDRLEYNAELDNIFHGRFLKERDSDGSKHWLELMEEFPEYLAQLRENDGISDSGAELQAKESENNKPIVLGNNAAGMIVISHDEEPDEELDEELGELRFGEFGGIYGEGEPFTINTYNGEDLLSQVLQYTLFSGDAGEFVALQIHNGADVRGGYTKPHIFTFGHLSEYDITDNAKASIHCTGKDRLPEAEKFFEKMKDVLNRRILPGMEDEFRESLEETRAILLELESSDEHHWSTDDAYHWYFQGSCGAGAETQLQKYEVVNLNDEDNEFNVEDENTSTKKQVWEPGKLCIKDGNGYCPYCGAKLAASSY